MISFKCLFTVQLNVKLQSESSFIHSVHSRNVVKILRFEIKCGLKLILNLKKNVNLHFFWVLLYSLACRHTR